MTEEATASFSDRVCDAYGKPGFENCSVSWFEQIRSIGPYGDRIAIVVASADGTAAAAVCREKDDRGLAVVKALEELQRSARPGIPPFGSDRIYRLMPLLS